MVVCNGLEFMGLTSGSSDQVRCMKELDEVDKVHAQLHYLSQSGDTPGQMLVQYKRKLFREILA